MPLELFFPEKGGANPANVRVAKQVCGPCPVRVECLDYGLEEKLGIWGGLGEHERRDLRRDRRRAS